MCVCNMGEDEEEIGRRRRGKIQGDKKLSADGRARERGYSPKEKECSMSHAVFQRQTAVRHTESYTERLETHPRR